jgi:hypothetical protein
MRTPAVQPSECVCDFHQVSTARGIQGLPAFVEARKRAYPMAKCMPCLRVVLCAGMKNVWLHNWKQRIGRKLHAQIARSSPRHTQPSFGQSLKPPSNVRRHECNVCHQSDNMHVVCEVYYPCKQVVVCEVYYPCKQVDARGYRHNLHACSQADLTSICTDLGAQTVVSGL